MIFDYTCGIVARTVAGNTCGGPSGFKPIAEQVSKGLSTFNIVDLFPSLKFLRMFTGTAYLRGIKKQLDEFAQNIIDEHRAARAKSSDLGQKGDEDNLVDVLLRVQADGELEFELTDGNIQGVLVVSFYLWFFLNFFTQLHLY